MTDSVAVTIVLMSSRRSILASAVVTHFAAMFPDTLKICTSQKQFTLTITSPS